MQATVLIPAAGSGRRMGTAFSKQYLELSGKPVLAHTLAAFEHHPQVAQIYLIVPEGDQDYCQRDIVERFDCRKVVRIVAGGECRQDSVRNGLLALQQENAPAADHPVLIHDGARPLFNHRLLSHLIQVVVEYGACTLGVPVKDTIKDVENSQIAGSPVRGRLWQAQTPQGFNFGLLLKAVEQAFEDGYYGTDDASLLERIGVPVRMVQGDYRNIKVTTQEDLLIAAALLDQLERESL